MARFGELAGAGRSNRRKPASLPLAAASIANIIARKGWNTLGVQVCDHGHHGG